MNREQIDAEIEKVISGLVYMPQLEALKRKLLNTVKSADDRKYASEKLEHLQLFFNTGRFNIDSYRKAFTKYSDKNSNLAKKEPQKKTKLKPDSFDEYSIYTYNELAIKTKVSIHFLENLVKAKITGGTLDMNGKITREHWSILSDFVLNKIYLLKCREKQYVPVLYPSGNYISRTQIKPRGGNFFKLIYIGRSKY
jgi:hypothetical protein